MLVAYELHTYRDGVWKIDSVFDDKDLAILEAQRVERSGRCSGLRVIEETFDQATNKTVTRTVYRSTKAEKINAEVAAEKKGGGIVVAPPTKKESPQKPKDSFARTLIMAMGALMGIGVLALAAIFAINTLAK